MLNKLFAFDEELKKNFNVKFLAGVDEVGRGCLSGPIVSCAVVFSNYSYIPDLKESKSISPQKRIILFKKILKSALDISVSILSVQIINKIGISKANQLVMKYAVDNLSVKPQLVVVDGYRNPYIDLPQYHLTKADKKSASVAAASIIAKVIRDTIMQKYHFLIPEYNFYKNKGYPTKEHIKAISKIGCCELHRYYAYKFLNIKK
ncbi:MAG: ribonuclease HII [Elusimicrobiota bacterium]|nr:ribonuclease HII [Endomicrobiia bacterium]MDW8166295.1 ribonuclease HII [Elusimicrobiota bacterium]